MLGRWYYVIVLGEESCSPWDGLQESDHPHPRCTCNRKIGWYPKGCRLDLPSLKCLGEVLSSRHGNSLKAKLAKIYPILSTCSGQLDIFIYSHFYAEENAEQCKSSHTAQGAISLGIKIHRPAVGFLITPLSGRILHELHNWDKSKIKIRIQTTLELCVIIWELQ